MRITMSTLAMLLLACSNDGRESDSAEESPESDTADDGTEGTFGPVSVSGSVLGLINGSVVLQLNGGFDLEVAEDGTFTFDSLIVDSDPFDVSVLRSPVGQSCSVSGGTGTASGDVVGVQVSCLCDFADELTDATAISALSIGDTNAFSESKYVLLADVEPHAWTVSCGVGERTLLVEEQEAPGLEGTAVEGGRVRYIGEPTWLGTSVWVLATVEQARGRDSARSDVLFRASPPLWEPEAVLAPALEGEARSIYSVLSVDIGTDGVVAGLVELSGAGPFGRLGVAKVVGDTTRIVFDSAEGLVVNGVTEPVCDVGEPVWSASGHIAMAVTYGDACVDPGSYDPHSGVVVLTDGESARLVLEQGSVDASAGFLVHADDVRVDDAGHAYVREWRCPTDAGCQIFIGGTGIIQIDLVTGGIVPIARDGEWFEPGRVMGAFGEFEVTPEGEVAALVFTGGVNCTGAACDYARQVMWWDGALQSAISSAEPLSGYSLTRGPIQLLPQSSGRLGVMATVEQGDDDHSAFMCWSPESGASVAVGLPANEVGGPQVRWLNKASFNVHGNYVASVVLEGEFNERLMLGTCP